MTVHLLRNPRRKCIFCSFVKSKQNENRRADQDIIWDVESLSHAIVNTESSNCYSPLQAASWEEALRI